MTDLDPEEDAVLESARRAFTPPDAATRRMRAALLAKVAAPGIVIGASAAASSAAASGAVASGAAASSAAASSAALTTASAAATAASSAPLAAMAGVVGTKVAVSAAVLKGTAGIATAVLLAAATSPYWLPETKDPEVVSAPAPAARTHAQSAHSAPATRAPKNRPAAVPDGETPGSAVTPKRIAIAAGPHADSQRMATPNSTPEQELQGELELLRRVQQAIQAGQSQLALELLTKLDTEHRASALGQEREVARVLALCGVGRVAAAREVAQRVLAVSPNSLYAGRIQSSCAVVAPTGPAPPSGAGSGKSTSSAPPVARFGDSGN